MTKNLFRGMAALCMCALFASCSKDAGFETPNQFELKKNEYNINFVKRYGEVDPNQSWDFTGYANSTRAVTRGSENYIVDSQVQEDYNFFSAITTQDLGVIQALLTKNEATKKVSGNNIKGTASIIDWNHNFIAKLTPFYAHSNLPVGTNRYYHLGFSGLGNNAAPQEMIANIKVKGFGYNYWYDVKKSTLIHHTSRDVNTNNAPSASYWCNYSCDANDENPFYKTTNITNDYSVSEIKKVREILIYVNNEYARTYWGFDCDGDDDYSDVICLVRNLRYPDPEPIAKRYLIEDLGDSDDFDFNDIVVDCEDDGKGNKTASIRAMGGTYDFTINIGGATWTKSTDGAKLTPQVKVIDMVNTKAAEISYSKVLATFPIPNWNPSEDNISVTIQESTYNQVYTIQFPHVGAIPMIVAVSTDVFWMTERSSVPGSWWKESSSEEE